MTTPGATNANRWVAGWLALPAVDPLSGAEAWGEPNVYWERPLAREAAAGWGEAGAMQAPSAARAQDILRELSRPDVVRWVGAPAEGLPGPWFGGMRFAAHGEDAGWSAFGCGRWTLPEVLVWRTGAGLGLAVFAPEGPGAEDFVRSRLGRLAPGFPSGYRPPRGAPQALRVTSARPDFEARVERAVEAIRAGALLKVVLARAVEVEAEHDFDRVDTLARLREHNPRCATFFFRAPDGTAFLGATPETLCRVEGRTLDTEALAGTAAPARSGELGTSDKDRREHEAVVRHILQTLEPLAEHVQADAEPALLPLKNVVHLRTGIHAVLREGVGVAELVAALQPTPAVGGTPRARALEFIATHEALDRGWYAGPVGWVGPGRAHQVVALRSARVKARRARLFVGAGIVEGSRPEAEWHETELKGQAMLRALGGDHV